MYKTHTCFKLLLALLLCSCATQRQAEKYFDENPEQLAEYVDNNAAYTETYGKAYAAKHFPAKVHRPNIEVPQALQPTRLTPRPVPENWPYVSPSRYPQKCPDCQPKVISKTVYLQDTMAVDSLSRELQIERLANVAIKEKLQLTEKDRDYWRELNRKKFWALVAMGVFFLLFVLFTILSSRIRVNES